MTPLDLGFSYLPPHTRLPSPPKKPPPPTAAKSAAIVAETSDRARANARRAVGARAEDVAAQYLLRAGCKILGRNVRVGRTEIDLLVRDGVVIVVVEVRTRGPRSYQRALDSIDVRKRARLRAAGASIWRERFARDTDVERMRFDAIAVTFSQSGAPLVEHVKAAF